MQYRAVPRTGLEVSCVCLGTMTFGTPVGREAAAGIVHWALDHGINFIDTADMYEGGVHPWDETVPIFSQPLTTVAPLQSKWTLGVWLIAFFLATQPGAAADPPGIAAWTHAQGGAVEKGSSGEVVGVDLTSTWVTDADMATLGRYRKLRKLDLSHTQITGVGLEHLRELREVFELNLYYAEYVSDSGIAHLKDWTQLEHLNLRGTKVTSRVFDHVASLETLRSLDLAFTEVTDAGFENLASLPHLEKLAIGGNRILGPGLSLLKLLPALKHLDVGGIQRVDSGLWGIALNDSNMRRLGELTRLEVLKLNGANIADRGLDRPGHKLALRQELKSLPNIAGLVELRTLELNRTPLTSAALGVLRELPQLRHLSLEYAAQVDDKAIPVLLALKQLESLQLSGTRVTDDGLRQLASLEHLKALRIGETAVTLQAVEKFRKRRPNCAVSWWRDFSRPQPDSDVSKDPAR